MAVTLTARERARLKARAHALCDEIGARADAAEVQRVGKVLVLWRPRPVEDVQESAS